MKNPHSGKVVIVDGKLHSQIKKLSVLHGFSMLDVSNGILRYVLHDERRLAEVILELEESARQEEDS